MKLSKILSQYCFALCITAGSFACGTTDAADVTIEQAEPRGNRGGSGLEAGSCEGACGGKSADGCWCDNQCAQFNDCCADKEAQCDGTTPPPAGGCTGYCGGKSQTANCWCDAQCAQYGDCCDDKAAVCDSGDVCDGVPVCALACGPAGFVKDENGCDTCECVECPSGGDICGALCNGEPGPDIPVGCPTPLCNCLPMCGGFAGLQCPGGMVCEDIPDDGCDPNNGGADCAGRCVPEQICPPVCAIFCPFGNVLDANGCPTCECIDTQSCGGLPGPVPNDCPEGFVCVPHPDPTCMDCPGTCEAQPPQCPDICGAVCAGEPEPPLPVGCPTPSCACPPTNCPDPNDPKVHYIANSDTNPQVCQVILFHCEDGQELFTGECGCGCIDGDDPTPAGNSCQGQCGGQSSDNSCWCDANCASFGDCCADRDVWCDGREPASGMCVKNAMDECSSDDDCVGGGCGGELCHNPANGGGISTCECSTPSGVSCGCVAGKCAWF